MLLFDTQKSINRDTKKQLKSDCMTASRQPEAEVFGGRLHKLREERGETLRVLGEVTGLSYVFIGDMERGLKVPPHDHDPAFNRAQLQGHGSGRRFEQTRSQETHCEAVTRNHRFGSFRVILIT